VTNPEYVYGVFETGRLVEMWGSRLAVLDRCYELEGVKPPPNWTKVIGSHGKIGGWEWRKIEVKRQKERSWYDDC